jgi:hypothetical protein
MSCRAQVESPDCLPESLLGEQHVERLSVVGMDLAVEEDPETPKSASASPLR